MSPNVTTRGVRRRCSCPPSIERLEVRSLFDGSLPLPKPAAPDSTGNLGAGAINASDRVGGGLTAPLGPHVAGADDRRIGGMSPSPMPRPLPPPQYDEPIGPPMPWWMGLDYSDPHTQEVMTRCWLWNLEETGEWNSDFGANPEPLGPPTPFEFLPPAGEFSAEGASEGSGARGEEGAYVKG
jgi:hypothetical protein